MQTRFTSNGHDFCGKRTSPRRFCGVRVPKEDGSSAVDELLNLGINSGKRCSMQTEKTVAVDGKKSESE